MAALGLSDSPKGSWEKDRATNGGRFEPYDLMEYLRKKAEDSERFKEPLYSRPDNYNRHDASIEASTFHGNTYKNPEIDRASNYMKPPPPTHYSGPSKLKGKL